MTTARHRSFPTAPLLALALGSAAVPQQAGQITARSIGGLQMCERLRRVNELFPAARDTLVMGEGDTGWPSKIVSVDETGWVLFESSWVDTTHVWRATTNSRRYQTPHGVRVGMSIGDLLRQKESMEFSYPEGYVVGTLVRDSVSFLVDDHSATDFWARFDFKADSVDALKVLSHEARITQLFTGGSCKH
jgi:hypothetical protein